MQKYPLEHVIGDDNYLSHCGGGYYAQGMSFGCVPRDYSIIPPGYYGTKTALDIQPFSDAEISARIKRMEKDKSRLSDILLSQNIPSLDQNGKGYCWSHSTTGAIIALRAAQGLPYVPLSAYAVACVIKNFRDEGGWGALSMDFAKEKGIPSESFWPAQSMSRSNDNPKTWENAALHKVTDGWIDLASAVYDRNMTFKQVLTLLCCRVPVVADYNWWGHSIYLVDPVEVSPGNFGVRFRNSWGDSYGEKGFSILKDSKAVPNGAVAPAVVLASAA